MQVQNCAAVFAVKPALYFTHTDTVAGVHVNSIVQNTSNQIQKRTQSPQLGVSWTCLFSLQMERVWLTNDIEAYSFSMSFPSHAN